MKIAIATDDGISVSQHYGQALSYTVITVEDDTVVGKEMREKAGHHTFAGHPDALAPAAGHGFGAGAESRHGRMAETIADCQVLIAGGMGWGAYHSLKSRNIEPVITDVANIDEAVKLYAAGHLPNLTERLH